MSDFNSNIEVCHGCSLRQRECSGACACGDSGQDIAEHARAGMCPKGYFDRTRWLSAKTPAGDVLDLIASGAKCPDGWHKWPNVQAAYRHAFRAEADRLASSQPDTDKPGTRGIAILGGGRFFASAWVTLRMIRHVGCTLPIELWHLPGEPEEWHEPVVAPYGVRCREAAGQTKGWEAKPRVIADSDFDQVLFLDADAYPVRDPSFLFDHPEYLRHGSIFWPDQRRLKRPVWESLGVPFRDEPELESGQIVIDKRSCGRELQLALWMNRHSDYYYRHVHGDKETFHLAWRMLGSDYALPAPAWRHVPPAMVQLGFDREPLFVHRSEAKFTTDDAPLAARGTRQLPISKHRNDKLPHEAAAWGFLDELKRVPTYIVRLGKNGDILTLLPALKYLANEMHRRVVLVVNPHYVPLVEKIPWLEIQTWEGSVSDPKVWDDCQTHYRRLGHTPDDTQLPDWAVTTWSRSELPTHLYFSLPLEIDNRDPHAEAAAVIEHRRTDKPLILLNTTGAHSPLSAESRGKLLRVLDERFADTCEIIDLSHIRLRRVTDLLGLFEQAKLLVSVDTSTLHLGYATRTPTIALVNDTAFGGSPARGHWHLRLKYAPQDSRSEATTPENLKRIADTAAAVLSGKSAPLARLAHGAIGIGRAVTGTGGASVELVEKRTAICDGCHHAVKTAGVVGQCKLCGCLLWAKVRNAAEKCPAGKW